MPIALRPLRTEDWEAVHRWAQLLEVCRYQAWGPNTPQQTLEFVEQAAKAWQTEPQEFYPFARDGWRDSDVYSILRSEWD